MFFMAMFIARWPILLNLLYIFCFSSVCGAIASAFATAHRSTISMCLCISGVQTNKDSTPVRH